MTTIGRISGPATALMLTMLAASPVGATVVATVGSEAAGCQFRTVEEAVAAVRASNDPDRRIRITNERLLEGVALTIDRSMTLIGGFPDCSPSAVPGSRRTILQNAVFETGIGVAAIRDSVVRVVGPASGDPIRVSLRNLSLERGRAVDGGGLHVSGAAEVTLEGSLVLANVANRGGGIFLDGTAGAMLTLVGSGVNGNSTESGATVPSGGGVYCTDGSVLRARDGSSVLGNRAVSVGSGGGVFATGCDIEIVGPFRLSNNSARVGGGLLASSESHLVLRGTAEGVVDVQGNRAVEIDDLVTGGSGIVLGSQSELLAQNVELRGNVVVSSRASAVVAGAIALTSGARAVFERTLGSSCPRATCSVIAANEASDAAVADVSDGSTLRLVNTVVEGNRAAEALFAIRDGGTHPLTTLALDGVTLVRNEAETLVDFQGNAAGDFVHTTIAFNEVGASAFRARLVGTPTPPRIAVRSSIVDQPGLELALFDPGTDFAADCVVASDGAGFEGQSRVVVADPELVSSPAGLDRLGPDSPAIDLCPPAIGAEARDTDLQARPFDDPLVPERSNGSFFDAGADERAPDVEETIFGDGFESGDLSGWSAVVG